MNTNKSEALLQMNRELTEKDILEHSILIIAMRTQNILGLTQDVKERNNRNYKIHWEGQAAARAVTGDINGQGTLLSGSGSCLGCPGANGTG